MRTEVRAAYFPSSKRHLLAAVGIFLRIFPESESEGDPLISLKLSGNSYMGQARTPSAGAADADAASARLLLQARASM